jgi:predicted ATPase
MEVLRMQRYILTGAPGSGKTSILGALHSSGHAVVREAATDVIAAGQSGGNDQPWTDPRFIEDIFALQRRRLSEPVPGGTQVQFHDRSPVCTIALARYLGYRVPAMLEAEVGMLAEEGIYQRQVFFVRPIGFVEPTAARRISYQDSLRFERFHEAEYERLGFDLIDVPPGQVDERAALIQTHVRQAGAAP